MTGFMWRALLPTHSCVPRLRSCRRFLRLEHKCREESRHGTHECARHEFRRPNLSWLFHDDLLVCGFGNTHAFWLPPRDRLPCGRGSLRCISGFPGSRVLLRFELGSTRVPPGSSRVRFLLRFLFGFNLFRGSRARKTFRALNALRTALTGSETTSAYLAKVNIQFSKIGPEKYLQQATPENMQLSLDVLLPAPVCTTKSAPVHGFSVSCAVSSKENSETV